MRAGADGYVTKHDELDQIAASVTKVSEGKRYFSPHLAKEIEGGLNDPNGSEGERLAQLTDREFQVLQLIGTGKKTQAIARNLSLSAKTVHCYRENLKLKLRLSDSIELLLYAANRIATLNGFSSLTRGPEVHTPELQP